MTVEAAKNVRRAEYNYVTDLNTLIKETARDRDQTVTQMSLETGNTELILHNYSRFHKGIKNEVQAGVSQRQKADLRGKALMGCESTPFWTSRKDNDLYDASKF